MAQGKDKGRVEENSLRPIRRNKKRKRLEDRNLHMKVEMLLRSIALEFKPRLLPQGKATKRNRLNVLAVLFKEVITFVQHLAFPIESALDKCILKNDYFLVG